MPKYIAVVVIGGSVGIEIEADSPEEAAELAMEHDRAQPTLCHQCSNDLELGDPAGVIIDLDGEEVYTDAPNDLLRQELAEVKAKCDALAAYVTEIKMLQAKIEERAEYLGRPTYSRSVDLEKQYHRELEELKDEREAALDRAPEAALTQHDHQVAADALDAIAGNEMLYLFEKAQPCIPVRVLRSEADYRRRKADGGAS